MKTKILSLFFALFFVSSNLSFAESNQLDETDVVLVPTEKNTDKKGKVITITIKVLTFEALIKHLSVFLAIPLSFYFARFLYAQLPSLQDLNIRIKEDHRNFFANFFYCPTLIYAGVCIGRLVGKQFGKWVVTKLPQKEEAKKSTDQQPTPSTSSDAPASN